VVDTGSVRIHGALGAIALRRGDTAAAARMERWLRTDRTDRGPPCCSSRARLLAVANRRDSATTLLAQGVCRRGNQQPPLDPFQSGLRPAQGLCAIRPAPAAARVTSGSASASVRAWWVVLALLPKALLAQGISSAAVDGRSPRNAASRLRFADVTIVNSANGERWLVKTNPAGRYVIDHLSVGGDYRIEVRAIGSGPPFATESPSRWANGRRSTSSCGRPSRRWRRIIVRGEAGVRRRRHSGWSGALGFESTLSRLPIADRDLFGWRASRRK